ncbi:MULTISPECIES: hypothetical protein [Paraburkholderia]|uniref:Uncharacterized protein n=2 Tax=Paraburkholderia TaxID=1822464 RepID=A0A7Y9WN57_9BURK|nr:hypothetical protein [Paraburkholderia bryophila]NYH23979.1 hypothetical protein [Paraburkholderia bryophila]
MPRLASSAAQRSAVLSIRFRHASAKKRRQAAMPLTVVVIPGAYRHAGDVRQQAKAKFANQDGR